MASVIEALEVELLGPPRWRQSPMASWTALSAMDAALLAVPALDGPQARDTLAGWLFPDADGRQAPNNLRKRISRLRVQTGHALFDAGATVRLLESLRVDVQFGAALPMHVLLDGELLAGCDFTGLDQLHLWAESRRGQWRAQRADALAGHAESLEKSGELAAAIRLALRIADLTPSHEVAWRRLMRLHYLRGDHTAAIEVFERFEALLRSETGARPGPETLRLLATIERGVQAQSMPFRRLPVSLVRPPKIVGRDAAWQAMQCAWAGERAFLLVGEAGIGKSRLLADFARQADGPVPGTAAAVLLEGARPGDAQVPYALLARVLRGALDRPHLSLPEPVRHELARVLPDLGPAPEADAHEARLRQAIEDGLVAAHEAGLGTLAVDDLHFADLASLEVLRWLGGSTRLRALRRGYAARPLEDGPEATLLAAWLCDSHRPERVVLNPLDPVDVEQLLVSLDLPEFTLPGLAARLHGHAGGQPLFTLETLKDAWLRGADLRSDALPRPQTVKTLIEGRLAELPAAALNLAWVCAVGGIDIDGRRAALLLETSEVALAAPWSLLERAGVLSGSRFTHDLVLDCALQGVPQPLRCALHGRLALLLDADPLVPPSRVAEHWQRAHRWAEAGAAWYRSGMAARRAGRLAEQQQMLERSAACHREAGQGAAEFEAVRASFDSILLRHGGNAVLAALPRLDSLASDEAALLECRLLRAEALLDVERSREALEEATAAVAVAPIAPRRLGDALCLRAMALAQLGRSGEAEDAARAAAEAAHACADRAQELRAMRSLSYSLYALGRLGESLPIQRRVIELAQSLGDEAESAAAEASIAALLGAAGDVPASEKHAASAARRYEAMGLDQNSTVGTTNLLVWGTAAAFLGRFGEALQVLERALRMASHDATVAAQAKARITLAGVHLLLGDAAAARSLAEPMPPGTSPGMRMQAALLLARAERMQGGDGRSHFEHLGRLGAEHPDLPLMQSAWVEWSYQGDSDAVLARLAPLCDELQRLGLPGAARSVQLREIARLGDRENPASVARAAELAAALLPHVATGMNARTYPPEAWQVLARAFTRARRHPEAERCVRAAVTWIRDAALPNVPDAAREGFLLRNPVNRELLCGAA
ncbi:MAG: AAA family ATPase [Rubrivivax sp.]